MKRLELRSPAWAKGQALFDGLTFKVAKGEERSRALELRRNLYRGELGSEGIDRFDEKAYHLVVQDRNGTVAAAARIVGPHQRPFDLEQFLVLSRFIPEGRTPAELGRLCIRQEYRHVRRQLFLHVGMLKLAYVFARRKGLTDFLILALPHLQNFYRTAFFNHRNASFEHPIWGKVHLMHLDLLQLEATYSRSSAPMARLLFGPDGPRILL